MLSEAEKLFCAVADSLRQRDAREAELVTQLAAAEATRDGYLAHLTASQQELGRERARHAPEQKT